MRHGKQRLQLNRFTTWRKATVISLAKSILEYQSIKTTMGRAKAAKPLVEKLISMAKENTLAAKRRAFQVLQDHKAVSALFNDIGPRYAARKGGFTRTFILNERRGDSATMVVFELTEIKEKPKAEKKKKQTEHTGHEDHAHEHEHVHEAEVLPEQPSEAHDEEAQKKQEKGKGQSKKFLGGFRGIFKKEKDNT